MNINQVKSVYEDKYFFLEGLLYHWYGQGLFSSSYENILIPIAKNKKEYYDFFGLKTKYLREYDYIDDEYLYNLVKPLISTKRFGGHEYFDYLYSFANEIREYKALVKVRDYLIKKLERRCKENCNIRNKIKKLFPYNIPHRLEDRLLWKFIGRIDTLTKKYFNPMYQTKLYGKEYPNEKDKRGFNKYHAEQNAFILAQLNILKGLKCPYKEKENGPCVADCIIKRFKEIENDSRLKGCDENIYDYSLCYSSRNLANCIFKDGRCPSFHPCPPGVKRYNEKLKEIKEAEKKEAMEYLKSIGMDLLKEGKISKESKKVIRTMPKKKRSEKEIESNTEIIQMMIENIARYLEDKGNLDIYKKDVSEIINLWRHILYEGNIF